MTPSDHPDAKRQLEGDLIGKHLATINLWREADNSIHVTFAEAAGVREELGDSGAPLHLCALNALRAAVEIRGPSTPWQPIETAPISAFDPLRWWELSNRFLVADARGYLEIASHGYTQKGKGRWVNASQKICIPNRWQPLPNAPVQS